MRTPVEKSTGVLLYTCMIQSSLLVTQEPTSEPITLDEVKAHLKLLADSDEDELLSMFISAARKAFETMTDGRIVMPSTFEEHFTGFPVPCYREPGILPLGVGNITSVEAVVYIDENGDEQELEGWSADLTGTPALVYLPGDTWPALSLSTPRPVFVEFVAGYTSVPAAVKLGILTLVGDWYYTREAHGSVDLKATPYGFDRFCQLYSTGLGGY